MIRKPPARRIRKTLILAALLAAASLAGAASAQNSTSASARTQQQIDALTQQLEAVQAELKELMQQNRALMQRQQEIEQQVAKTAQPNPSVVSTQATPTPPTANPVPPASNPVPPTANPLPPSANPVSPSSAFAASPSNPAPPAPPGPVVASNGSSPLGNLKLWGYGELYYTRPTHDERQAEADLARAVFGIGYVFDSRTEFNSEFEVEHAVSSADDPGEFEVEQFYIDRRLNDAVALRAGLFLMPFGMLNEHHEPTNFYGVQRNFVETLIIPSTWREGGFNLHGDTSFGLNWNAGLTTGFDLSKWNFAPEFPLYTTALDLEDSDSAPLQATHQELALANAQHLSQYVALGYYVCPASLSVRRSVRETRSKYRRPPMCRFPAISG